MHNGQVLGAERQNIAGLHGNLGVWLAKATVRGSTRSVGRVRVEGFTPQKQDVRVRLCHVECEHRAESERGENV